MPVTDPARVPPAHFAAISLSGAVQVQAKGVDSVGKGFADPAGFVRHLAKKQRTSALSLTFYLCV